MFTGIDLIKRKCVSILRMTYFVCRLQGQNIHMKPVQTSSLFMVVLYCTSVYMIEKKGSNGYCQSITRMFPFLLISDT
jgi:hypothetical protein